MKFSKTVLFLFLTALTINCKNEKPKANTTEIDTKVKSSDDIKIIQITHGTFIIETDKDVIYIDPTGGKEAFEGQKKPTAVLITDIHGDHLSTSTLERIDLENSAVIVPQAVADKIPTSIVASPSILNNGETMTLNDLKIEAIPMYNLREEALNYHTKGRGNGYVITVKGKRIYISGDTEDIPEMRALEDIDIAFVCMNLPYTMTVKSAVSAVTEFKPKRIYPYHYRGKEGLSDIALFKELVKKSDLPIEVILLDWY